MTALREPEPGDGTRLLGGLCFMPALPRSEVREALRARVLSLDAQASSAEAAVRSIEETRLAPAPAAELSRLIRHWLAGERSWVEELCGRIDAGHYRFAGEPGAPDLPVEGIWPAAVPDSPERA